MFKSSFFLPSSMLVTQFLWKILVTCKRHLVLPSVKFWSVSWSAVKPLSALFANPRFWTHAYNLIRDREQKESLKRLPGKLRPVASSDKWPLPFQKLELSPLTGHQSCPCSLLFSTLPPSQITHYNVCNKEYSTILMLDNTVCSCTVDSYLKRWLERKGWCWQSTCPPSR